MPRKASKKATKARKPAKKTTRKPAKKAVRKPAKKATKKAVKRTAKKTAKKSAKTVAPAKKIDQLIRELGDWRGATLAEVRAVIKKADPAIVEMWMWEKPSSGGVPVWYHNGIVCTGEPYKDKVKLTFAKGASVKSRLFNSSLEGNVRRAIDIHEGEKIKKTDLAKVIKAAVAVNLKKRPPR